MAIYCKTNIESLLDKYQAISLETCQYMTNTISAAKGAI